MDTEDLPWGLRPQEHWVLICRVETPSPWGLFEFIMYIYGRVRAGMRTDGT